MAVEESTSAHSVLESFNSSKLLLKLMSKRRTWVFLFVSVYSILLFLSWNLLKSVLSWYELESSTTSSPSGWPALYASVLLGVSFGILSRVAALAVAVPATLVTWITVLVLLTFCGKPRKTLVVEGKKLTAEITGFVVTVLIKEGTLRGQLFCIPLLAGDKSTNRIGGAEQPLITSVTQRTSRSSSDIPRTGMQPFILSHISSSRAPTSVPSTVLPYPGTAVKARERPSLQIYFQQSIMNSTARNPVITTG